MGAEFKSNKAAVLSHLDANKVRCLHMLGLKQNANAAIEITLYTANPQNPTNGVTIMFL